MAEVRRQSPVPTANINIYKGDELEINYTWNDSNGDPIDITGYSAKCQFRDPVTDPDGTGTPLLEVDSDTVGEITLGGAAGTIEMKWPSAKTATLTVAEGKYDLELTSPAGVVKTLVSGTGYVTMDITRP